MKVAVLFSGQLRGFKYVVDDLKKYVLDKFEHVDTFFYVNNCSYQVESYFTPTKCVYYDDAIYDANGVNLDKAHVIQGFLAQWFSLMSANELRKEYSNDYDLILRIRPDAKFESELDLSKIDIGKINVCTFGDYGGINDRFAIGNVSNMDIYCDFFKHISAFRNGNSEQKLQSYLISRDIPINYINYQWYRINENGHVRYNEE